MQVHFAAADLNATAPEVRHAYAEAAVFHCAGDTRFGIALQNGSNRFQRFYKSGRFIRNLTVGSIAGANGVEYTEFKRRQPYELRELV
jgi:hypothetical protein